MANLIASTAGMSFLQLNLQAHGQTKARPLILAGLIALGLSWELRPLPAADENLRETAAALTQTGLPDKEGISIRFSRRTEQTGSNPSTTIGLCSGSPDTVCPYAISRAQFG
jgi:hypothetical protein